MRAILLLTLAILAPTVAAETPLPRLITVTGQGEVLTTPDRADVSLSIESRSPELSEARDDVATRVNSFLREIDSLKIDRKRISNSGLVVRPEFRWDKETESQVLTGYFVSRQMSVDLRDLEKLGPLLERSVSAGVNQVSPPQLGSSREAELRREAMRRAAEDARLNAAAIAEKLSARLGAPHSVNVNQGGYMPPMPMRGKFMAMAEAAPAEQSYETGQISFNVELSVSFDLITE